MCGIAGFVSNHNPTRPEALLAEMTGSIVHRGPDDSGHYCEAPAFLGHRRLSIIDVAGGHQPMPNEDRSMWIVYNGEIFNHAATRPELERAGHIYATRCDTETIVHAYEEFGPACLERFRGMFAFAIWDSRKQELFCARDRLGIKPFYYFYDGRTFVFASEIKALLKHPAVPAEFDQAMLPEHLAFGYTIGDRTLFRNIRKLMPGHWLRLSLAGQQPDLQIREYWDLPRAVPADNRPEPEIVAELRRRFEETVEMRLMSDVPLGVFLSGGVDSTAIAAMMKRLVSGRVKTFSVGYQEQEFSEAAYAADTARQLGTDHHQILVGADDFFDALPKLVWHEDEPICWPSSVSLYFVAKLSAERVKVVLTGEGSDELFAGYSRYRFYTQMARWLPAYGMVPRPVREMIRRQVNASSLLSAGLRRKIRHTFVGRGEDLESLYIDNFFSAFPAEEQRSLHSLGGSPYASYRSLWDQDPSRSVLQRMLYADQKSYLVELLMKQDQMSMACSIESRVPLLDHTFVEFAATIPDAMKIRNGSGKYIFKRAVEHLVPPEVIHRKKLGFPTPVRQWLSGTGADRLSSLLTKDSFIGDYLNLDAVRVMLERHRGGEEDATDRIWRLMNLELWGKIFFAGKSAEELAPARACSAL